MPPGHWHVASPSGTISRPSLGGLISSGVHESGMRLSTGVNCVGWATAGTASAGQPRSSKRRSAAQLQASVSRAAPARAAAGREGAEGGGARRRDGPKEIKAIAPIAAPVTTFTLWPVYSGSSGMAGSRLQQPLTQPGEANVPCVSAAVPRRRRPPRAVSCRLKGTIRRDRSTRKDLIFRIG